MTPQGKKNDPDETIGSLVGTDAPKEKFCLEDQVGGAWAWATIKKMVVDVARRDGQEVKICFEQEPASGGKNQVAELIEVIKAELPDYDVTGLEAKKLGDRVLAANTWFGEAADGLWYVVKGLWNESFFGQLDYFPNPAIHDDRITSVSGARHKIAPIRKWKKIKFLAIGHEAEAKEGETKPESVVLRFR
jgi:phage terminase large subunit-like protein